MGKAGRDRSRHGCTLIGTTRAPERDSGFGHLKPTTAWTTRIGFADNRQRNRGFLGSLGPDFNHGE